MCKYLIMAPCVLGRKKKRQYKRQTTLLFATSLDDIIITTNNNEINCILLFRFKQKLFATNLDSINKLNSILLFLFKQTAGGEQIELAPPSNGQ